MILSRSEWMVAKRYLLPGRGEGFLFLVASISLIAVMLGVASLIIVMSVMNGFRAELFDKTVGLNGHAVVQGYGGRLPGWRDGAVLAGLAALLVIVVIGSADDRRLATWFVIGAGGENIKRIQKKSNCRLQVRKKSKDMSIGFGGTDQGGLMRERGGADAAAQQPDDVAGVTEVHPRILHQITPPRPASSGMA